MRMYGNEVIGAFLACLIMALACGCGSGLELAGTFSRDKISMDGSDSSWHNSMRIIEDNGIALGFRQDGKDLYVCVTPMNRLAARQIMMLGLTVWFDSTAGKNKIFGIHFPIGLAGYGLTPRMIGGRGDNESRDDIFKSHLNELEIVRPGEFDNIRVDVKDLEGIAVKMNLTQEGLFYVLKVPMRITGDHPYALSSRMVDKISVGLETGEMKMEKREGDNGFEGRGGGEGGSGGRRGGGMRGGGMRGGGMREGSGARPSPLKIWAKVRIFENDSPTE